jgi:hypothetical protein
MLRSMMNLGMLGSSSLSIRPNRRLLMMLRRDHVTQRVTGPVCQA